MSDALLLDTCALIWMVNGDKMSDHSRKAIIKASQNGQLFACPMSAWEVGMLVKKNRLALSLPIETWFEKIEANPGIQFIDIDIASLIRSTHLPGNPPSDPVDRMMLALARSLDAAIVTRDAKIIKYAKDGYVNSLAC